MPERSKRRDTWPYRALFVVIIGGVLALVLAAFSNPTPLTPRALLLLPAGLLLVVAIALEIVFRDVARLRERVRSIEKDKR